MSDYPARYELFNSIQNKELSVVLQIDGVSTLLSSTDLFTRVRYGDPDLFYGDPGLIYGGLIPLTDENGDRVYKSLMSLEKSSLTLSQKLEPEQGRGSVSTLGLAFIDQNQFMTRLASPGVYAPDFDLLGRSVKVWLGYKNISFPDDYFVVFRGVVSSIKALPGLVMLQFSDSNIRRRQKLFYTATTKLSAAIDASTTTIPVVSNGDFHKQILGPNGSYDPAIKTYLKIDDEWIEYDGPSFSTNQFLGVTRGSRGSAADSHASGSDVTCAVQVEEHMVDMALKLMLSGWNGPFLENVGIRNLVRTGDPASGDVFDAIIFPDNIDVVEEYGLTVGDYLDVTDATDPLNNKTGAIIVDILPLFDRQNRIIIIDSLFNSVEIDSPAKLSFRSQYDVYPETCGLKLLPSDVDVEEHLEIKNLFLISEENELRFFITGQENQGKTFLEKELYLPCACYSLTRFGRMSMGITKPPIADERLQILSVSNILDPEQIAPERSLNNRGFFNEIQFFWDANDDGEFTSALKVVDTNSLNIIGLSSILPIESKGSRTDLGNDNQFSRRAEFLLSRYKQGAETISLTVNYGTGNQIEAGDVIALSDNNQLQISNISTGERNIGVRLYEVIERAIDLRSGRVKIKLISGIGGEYTDKYGTVSPSTLLDTGSTLTSLAIKDSFGALYPNNESRKWRDYVGEDIMVHSADYSDVRICQLVGIDPTNRFKLQVSGLTGTVPPADYVIDIPDYPTDPNPLYAIIYKSIHAFQDPQVDVITGTSMSSFEVSSGDIDKFFVGTRVSVHSDDYSVLFSEKTITDVVTGSNEVFVDDDFDFVPTGGMQVDLIGFSFDRGGAYRQI